MGALDTYSSVYSTVNGSVLMVSMPSCLLHFHSPASSNTASLKMTTRPVLGSKKQYALDPLS